MGDDYGHYGWQSMLSGMGSAVTSTTVSLGDSAPSTMTLRIPAAGVVNAGIISVAPDSDGFDAPVSVSVGSASQSSGSGDVLFHNVLD
ncbi:MAG TPA: hypothetical protein EYP52_10700, partial [Anaerolineae bacterium]|nr:hypothetical protein [Anaerolineae bacterium]